MPGVPVASLVAVVVASGHVEAQPQACQALWAWIVREPEPAAMAGRVTYAEHIIEPDDAERKEMAMLHLPYHGP